MESKEFYTIEEAARELQVSRSQVYRFIKAGWLHPSRHPLFKPKARVRIPRSEVEALKETAPPE